MQIRADTEAMKRRLLQQRLEGLQHLVEQGHVDEAVSMCNRLYELDCEELRVKQAAAFAREMAGLSSNADPAQIAEEEERIRKLQMLERDALSVAHEAQLATVLGQLGDQKLFDNKSGAIARASGEFESTRPTGTLEDLQAEKMSRLRKLQVNLISIS